MDAPHYAKRGFPSAAYGGMDATSSDTDTLTLPWKSWTSIFAELAEALYFVLSMAFHMWPLVASLAPKRPECCFLDFFWATRQRTVLAIECEGTQKKWHDSERR